MSLGQVMIMRSLTILVLGSVAAGGVDFATTAGAADPLQVIVWDEQQPAQKEAYPQFLGNQIAAYLKSLDGLEVNSVKQDDPDQGLPKEVLDNCDVLVWWGHIRQHDVSEERARDIVERVRRGQLDLIALHSAHWALPFMIAMEERTITDAIAKLPEGKRSNAKVRFIDQRIRRAPKYEAPKTPAVVGTEEVDGVTTILMRRPNCCFPAYRPDAKPSTIEVLMKDHPIAQGLPEKFMVPHTEMYDEHFHVPAPDQVVLQEHWELGEQFRSGSVWNLGQGKIFYFRPGHEIFNVYFQDETLRVLENAVRWLGSTP